MIVGGVVMHPFPVVTCYLGLGSSLGYRENYLRFGIERLSAIPGVKVLRLSNFYETEPIGGVAHEMFLNAAASIETSHSPEELLEIILRIEKDAGRDRHQRYEDRTLDIDILYYGDRVIRTESLHIPHAQIALRRFVLVPLAEIAPDFLDPVTQSTISQLLKKCPDKSGVYPYHPETPAKAGS